MLKNLIISFSLDRTQEHFLNVLVFLRDSLVWIPCNAVVSDANQNTLLEMIENTGDVLENMVGCIFSN